MNIKKKIIVVISLLAIGLLAGYFLHQGLYEKKVDIIETNSMDQFDLHLPGEVEKRIITENEIEAKLVEIGQLATYSGEYTVSKSANHTRYLFDDISIPFTTNSIGIECKGIVKVGYDVNDIKPSVDNKSQKIYIALPVLSILDNYVIWDSVKYAEANNILNPIDFAEYQALLDEIEQEGLAQVEEEGIRDAAEENVKTIIRNFLAGFNEYEIVFM